MFQNLAVNGSRGRFVPMRANHAPILVTVTAVKSNLWTVESSDHSLGGTFVSRKAALGFAQEAMLSHNAAVVVNEDRILEGERHNEDGSSGAARRDAIVPFPRPRIATRHPRAKAASKPLFSDQEVVIGFSLLALAFAFHALT
jgi:hypothetical protein